MVLSKKNIPAIAQQERVLVPAESCFGLPEKVLQFGAAFLIACGLPQAYFIDKANRQGIFNGRIVVVKSTSQGNADAFTIQDNLYTILA